MKLLVLFCNKYSYNKEGPALTKNQPLTYLDKYNYSRQGQP